jgi:hypothetical protein
MVHASTPIVHAVGLLFAKRFGKLSVPRHQWGFGSESAGSFKCFARSAASFR